MKQLELTLCVNRTEIDTTQLGKNQTAVVIDVLRASTTMIAALNNGCHSIIPVTEVDDALAKAKQLGKENVLLGGERNEVLVPGFDLSNSPLEYTKEVVKDKEIVFTSTNGARLFSYLEQVGKTVVCSFVNLSKISKFLFENSKDIIILCAGKNGKFGLEDVVCGGMLIASLLDNKNTIIKMNDGAGAALTLYQNFSTNILSMLYQTSHGKRLLEIGNKHDLEFCGAVDLLPIIPVFINGRIVQMRDKNS
ncbi:hypothetical protein B6I21_03830 [candidate division KSB1 bacterium 4572_119]|nr:MAG: hypothetical protein B6I21_03830 [candidate division KSB1 bacterium 4572_119]